MWLTHTPRSCRYDVRATGLDLQLNANSKNVIDLPSDPDANTLVYVSMPQLRAVIKTPCVAVPVLL